jgi:anaerobic selenocysteine-containing dehydrogenase
MTSKTEKQTFCRVCEPSCGLIATLEEGTITALKPDRDHPVTRGFACHKGLSVLDIHQDPDRLNWPLVRQGATLKQTSWQEAAVAVGDKIKALQATYGDQAIGVYTGNPLAFNSTAGPAIGSFVSAIGSRRNFSSGTQDCSNKFAASEAVFGSSTIHPIPDIAHTDFLLILGANPRVSHMSFVSIADPIAELRAAKQRGARLVFVDPRQNESVSGLGELLQIKPDTDTYLLAAMVHHCFSHGLIDTAVTARYAEGLDFLEAFAADYSAQKVTSVVGLTVDAIEKIASEFAAADRAAVYMSTGVNMGRQGALAYWLLYMLSFITGNLGRQGGNKYAQGFYPAAKAGATRGHAPSFEDSPFGPIRKIRGSLPGNLMADMILNDANPIRGLVVISGNPLLSIGNSQLMKAALEKLEFLVVIDIYPSATSEYADVVLPATDMLERADINLSGLGLQHQPFVQFTEPMAEPAFERRPEWQIMALLEQGYEQGQIDETQLPDPFSRLNHMLKASDTSIEALMEEPVPVKVLPLPNPESFYDSVIQTESGLIDCCPDSMSDARIRCADIFSDLNRESPSQLKMISRRTNYMLNSWFHNLPGLKRPKHRDNPLYMHPDDAAERQISAGAVVAVSNTAGALEVRVELDATLRPGVVAMTHGWGHQGSKMQTAASFPGANCNVLLPSGPDSFDPFSNQSFMTGIPVEVRPSAPGQSA